MRELVLVLGLVGTLLALGFQLEKNARLEEEKSFLTNINRAVAEREKAYALETSKRIEALEELAKKDSSFDWNRDISSSPVVLQLRKD